MPCIGIIEHNGKVRNEVVPDDKSEVLLRQAVRIVKDRCLVYTDRIKVL